MQFTIETATLLEALSMARTPAKGRITPNETARSAAPVLTLVKLHATHDYSLTTFATKDTGLLELRATNLDQQLDYSAPISVEQAGTCYAPAEAMLAAVKAQHKARSTPKAKAANPDTLTVRVETTHTGKVLRVGTARIPLPDQDKSAVEHPAHIAPPSLTQMHKQPYLSFPAAQLGQDLADVGIAMSTEEFRYYLTGIYLEPMPEGERVLGVDHGPLVSMAATDSHRLHRAIRDWPDEDKGCSSADACDLPSVIVPRQAVHWLAHWSKRLGKSGAKPLVTLRWTTRFLVANIGRATFTTRLVDGTFPDYRRVIPAPQQTYTLHAEAHRITASAKLVKNLLTDGDKAARIAADTSAAAPLTMGGASHGSGAAQTPVAGFTSYEGPQGAFEVGFNAGYIIDTMKPFGKSAVSIRIPDASAPTLVVSDDRPEFTVVLMPMRI